jgi:hypothetical protein
LKAIESIAGTEETDEIAQSLIETFPASDPPAWIPLARVGIPCESPFPSRHRKHDSSD